MTQEFYQLLLAPHARSEDLRRREFVLNILLLGTISLALVLTMVAFAENIMRGTAYDGTPLSIPLGVVAVFLLLLVLSRIGLSRLAGYLYVGIFLVLATYPTVRWGLLLPQGILTYALVIVVTGVLIGSRMAFWMAILMFMILATLVYLLNGHFITFDQTWMKTPSGYNDAVSYGITFVIIALVSWLSNREVERSLSRARISEAALRMERRSLETKVRERTSALEKAQVEKMLDLQRFAEFGRQSSTLLHELANPLMAASLNLEELEGKNRSKFVSRARESIAHMEQYVKAARRQLRNESEITEFDVADEIERVSGFIEPKAMEQGVGIELELAKGIQLTGDSIRFNHIISNLLSNAIDAYDDIEREHKVVTVIAQRQGRSLVITVRDHGSGITKDQLKHLFEPFYTTKKEGHGTGIGLSITKHAVEEAFTGTIAAMYDKRQGTRFVVRLPLI